ncbi:glycine--tRNA ligase subunit alpha, partial [Lactobacillus delbrueckii]
MTQKLDIQTMIFKLEQFWASKGCMIMPSYDENKGAGTMSPYTFLRAVGPEP